METEAVFSPSGPLGQGDLIARANFEGRHPLDRFAVVVTADCDLARARPDHQVTFLRVAPVADYVHHVWCRKKIHVLLGKMKVDTTAMFNRLSSAAQADRLPIDPERLIEWLISTSSQEICDSLSGVEESQTQRLRLRLDQLASAASLAALDDASPALDALIGIRRLEKSSLQVEEARETIIQQARNELATESDELFFLSRLVQDEKGDGYYVLLDRVGAIRRGYIFDYKSKADEIEDGAHRFGRLVPSFKYAVVQRFAFLFQRIGLPDERLDWHRGALQKLD